MSLRAFHVVFITASTLLALGLAWWCLPVHPVGATGAALVALGLVVYEVAFLRKTRKLT